MNCIYCGFKFKFKNKECGSYFRRPVENLVDNNFDQHFFVEAYVSKIQSKKAVSLFRSSVGYLYTIKKDMWLCINCKKRTVTNLPQKYTEEQLLIKRRIKEKHFK